MSNASHRILSGRNADERKHQYYEPASTAAPWGATSCKPVAGALLCACLLAGCGGEASTAGNSQSAVDTGLTTGEDADVPGFDHNPEPPAPKAPNDPLLELANRLRSQREALEAQRVQRENLVVKRRGELARLTADLQRQIRRAGQTVEAVLAEFSKAVPTQGRLAALHADYLRAGQLENHVARLTKALDADAGLQRNLLRTEEKLRQDAEANAALDPAQREAAEELLAEAKEHDPFAPAPDGTLKPESVELQASLDVVASALKTRVAAMPARPETSIDDVPALPELNFETSSDVEATFLTAMQNDLASGRKAAARLFTDKQPEAAIERLHDALDAVRARLASLKTPPAWSADCTKLLDEAAAALSEQLAGPYLAALDNAAKDAYLATDEAARTAKWAHVMDLLEALVQLAPQAKNVPEQFRQIDEYLYSQERLEGLEAAVARERFETIRQMLTPGARRREVSRRTSGLPSNDVVPANISAGQGGQLHGVSLTARQAAHKALAEAGHRYLELDARVRQLLLRFKPDADTVRTTEQARAAAMDDVRRLLAARDVEDSRVFVALEEKTAERHAARSHLTTAIGLREDASEVQQVDAQIVAIQQSEAAFKPGHDRAAGRGPSVDLLQFVANPLNLLIDRVITINGVDFPFVSIPGGSFKMGHDAASLVDVTLTGSYWMLKTEVTQAMYNVFVKERPWKGREHVKEGADYPAVYVSAEDADAWCQNATDAAKKEGLIEDNESIRLPTEAQWEYAARGGTTTAYFFGDDASRLGEYAWYDDNAYDIGEQYAHQVGLKKPNPFGLLDVSGNVWEWCADGYQSDLPGGTDPRVSPAGSSRVCRGGAFCRAASACRVGYRYYCDATYSYSFIGFRVVLLVE